MNYDPRKAIRQALMIARRQAAYGGQQGYPGYAPIDFAQDENSNLLEPTSTDFGGGGSGVAGSQGPPGAPGTGNFGQDLASFAEATAPAMAGAAMGAAMGGPAGAIGGLVGSTMAQGLAEAFGLSTTPTAPVGSLASVVGNVAQTQMGMQPTSNPMDALSAAFSGPAKAGDQEDADQGAAMSAAANAAAAAAAADNANSMSMASTQDAVGGTVGSGAPGGPSTPGAPSGPSDQDNMGEGTPGAPSAPSGESPGSGDSPGGESPGSPSGDSPGGEWRGGSVGKADGGNVALPIDSDERKQNFRDWFGNSKMIDENGEPMVLYHATSKNFSDFKPGGDDPAMSGRAIWLTPNKEIQPAAHNTMQLDEGGKRTYKSGANVMPVHAKIEKPLYITDQFEDADARKYKLNSVGFPMSLSDESISAIRKDGYDGIIYARHKDPEGYDWRTGRNIEVIAFHPKQIKSAIGNRGTYNPNDANITRADGGAVDPFLSNAVPVEGPNGPTYTTQADLDERIQQAALGQGYADGGQVPQMNVGDDPTVQRALNITRGAQPAAPDMARQVQPMAMPATPQPVPQQRGVFSGYSNLLQDNGDHPGRISQRAPKSAKGDDPISGNLMADTEASAAAQDAHDHNIRLLATYPGMPAHLKDAPTDEILQHFTNLAKGNLMFLHDLMPPEIRERSKLWYNGARNIAEKFADKYNMPDASAAGTLAALSPQKDWYMNVSLAERLLDILHNQENIHYTKEMENRANKVIADPKFDDMLNQIRGKRLADIDDPKYKALFVRLYDEAHNPRAHRIVTPEGNFGEMRNKNNADEDDESGGSATSVSWGSLSEIAKAIQAAQSGGTKEELSPLMGQYHKVRNFHNNIVAPDAPHGDVTIDTHAVAAALLRPLSGSSTEVFHNFGTSPEASKKPAGFVPTKNSGITGISGTYPIIADAYRQAAEKLGILPRELQSITWEGIRGIFSPVFKRNSNSVAAVNDIWQRYGRGEIDIDDARKQILEIAGGMDEPTWVRPSGRDAGRTWDSSYERKLSAPSSLRENSEVDGGIGGEPAGGFAGAEPISERDVAQLARARGLGRAVRNAAQMVGRENGLPASHRRVSGQPGKRIVAEEAPDFGADVAHVHMPDEGAQQFLQDNGISHPNIYELKQGKKSAGAFYDAINDAKQNNDFAAAVHLYEPQEYQGMRLFLTPDKKAGFALKGDDIVSVFNNKSGQHKNISNSLLQLALKEGGRKLDAFDTVLPAIYARNGFKVVSRLPFNDEYRPEGWDYDKYAAFNNGRPDVVFMAYDPKRSDFYSANEGKYASDYDAAVKTQDQTVKRVNASLQKLSKPKAEEPTKADGGSVIERALRLTAPYRPMVALADLFQRQLRGRPPS